MAKSTFKPNPQWLDFEIINANIQRQLAPDAIVRHNQRIRGKSGRKRQFDIISKQKIGLVNITIGFECKRHSRPVSIEKVDAFISKIHDVGISAGVMISGKGFDAGAKARAVSDNIRLFTYTEAETADWNSLFGEGAWMNFLYRQYTMPSAKVNWASGEIPVQITVQSPLCIRSEDGKTMVEIGPLGDVIASTYSQVPTLIGTFQAKVTPDNDTFILANGTFRLVHSFDLVIHSRVTAYPVSLSLGSGFDFRQVDGSTGLKEVASEAFDWRSLIETVQGTDLTQEEYEQMLSGGGNVLSIQNAKGLKRYLRIVVSQKNLGQED